MRWRSYRYGFVSDATLRALCFFFLDDGGTAFRVGSTKKGVCGCGDIMRTRQLLFICEFDKILSPGFDGENLGLGTGIVSCVGLGKSSLLVFELCLERLCLLCG